MREIKIRKNLFYQNAEGHHAGHHFVTKGARSSVSNDLDMEKSEDLILVCVLLGDYYYYYSGTLCTFNIHTLLPKVRKRQNNQLT